MARTSPTLSLARFFSFSALRFYPLARLASITAHLTPGHPPVASELWMRDLKHSNGMSMRYHLDVTS